MSCSTYFFSPNWTPGAGEKKQSVGEAADVWEDRPGWPRRRFWVWSCAKCDWSLWIWGNSPKPSCRALEKEGERKRPFFFCWEKKKETPSWKGLWHFCFFFVKPPVFGLWLDSWEAGQGWGSLFEDPIAEDSDLDTCPCDRRDRGHKREEMFGDLSSKISWGDGRQHSFCPFLGSNLAAALLLRPYKPNCSTCIDMGMARDAPSWLVGRRSGHFLIRGVSVSWVTGSWSPSLGRRTLRLAWRLVGSAAEWQRGCLQYSLWTI